MKIKFFERRDKIAMKKKIAAKKRKKDQLKSLKVEQKVIVGVIKIQGACQKGIVDWPLINAG